MLNANQKISQAIASQMAANGGDLEQAIDAVLGAGTYERIVAETYNAFRE